MAVKQVAQVLSTFTSSVDTSTNYSLKDLTKLLETAYKDVYGNKRVMSKKNPTGEKKVASAYNTFIKEEITRLKEDAIANGTKMDPKDYMKLAAVKWREHKGQNTVDDAASIVDSSV